MKTICYLLLASVLLFISCKKTEMSDHGSYTLEMISGNNQMHEIDKDLPAEIIVRVIDKNNSPIQNVKVKFDVHSGGGTTNLNSAITSINGTATITWKLGAKVGEQKLRASVDQNNINANPLEIVAF